jgi:integrase
MPSLKLRQDTVKTLPYAGTGLKQQCIYWDTALECFGLRVYPSERRAYVCSYRVNGRKRLALLGRADVLSLDHARKKAIAYLGKVAEHQDPQSDALPCREAISVEALSKVYLEEHAKKKKKSWRNDESAFRIYFLPKLKYRLATSIVSADLEAIHSAVGVAHPYRANHLLVIYRKMVNWAKVAGKLPRDYQNPVTGIVRFPERKRKRFVTTVEMPRFLRSLELEESEYGRHGVWLLLLTGLRSTELLNAKWADIDWDMGTLFIGLTKNGEPLLAPLSDAAIARLKMIPRIEGNPYIICGQKIGQHFSELGPVLTRVLKRAKLENIRIHDLRRTVGSWLAHAGSSLHLIGDVLNHKDPKTTAGYAFFQTQQRRDALTGHGQKVLALGGSHIAAPAAETALSAEKMLVPEIESDEAGTVARRRHYFRREDLYKLVWTAPVLELAARLGVSDVALAKLCRRAGIPIPGRGYWARVDAGQEPKRPSLPPAPQGLPELLRIRGSKPALANAAEPPARHAA